MTLPAPTLPRPARQLCHVPVVAKLGFLLGLRGRLGRLADLAFVANVAVSQAPYSKY
jgi:hypothetical protein